jgi:cbb3-type cytochrome oxidase maturation protein
MGIIALLITISLTIALLFLGVFLWSMKSGQYDDTYTPSVRMLFDDKPVNKEPPVKRQNHENLSRTRAPRQGKL